MCLTLQKRLFLFLSLINLFGCTGFSCSMWDLVPWSGFEPESPTLRAQSLSHCGVVPPFLNKKIEITKNNITIFMQPYSEWVTLLIFTYYTNYSWFSFTTLCSTSLPKMLNYIPLNHCSEGGIQLSSGEKNHSWEPLGCVPINWMWYGSVG